MNETPRPDPSTPPHEDFLSYSPPAAPPPAESQPWYRRGITRIVGLLAAGALAGAAVTTVLHGQGTPQAAATGLAGSAAPSGGMPYGSVRDGFGAGPGPGGFDGEQRLSGTVTAVGSSAVTVKTTGGTATYTVNRTTEIVRNGARAALADLRSGDPVLIHVYPSGRTMLVERIIAGTLPAFPGHPGGHDGPGSGTRGGTSRT